MSTPFSKIVLLVFYLGRYNSDSYYSEQPPEGTTAQLLFFQVDAKPSAAVIQISQFEEPDMKI